MDYQTEAAECGLACIAMVANHHGHQLNLSSSRNRFIVLLKGSTLQQIMLIANQLGLASRALKLELADLNKLQTPCILYWVTNNFVVPTRMYRCAN